MRDSSDNKKQEQEVPSAAKLGSHSLFATKNNSAVAPASSSQSQQPGVSFFDQAAPVPAPDSATRNPLDEIERTSDDMQRELPDLEKTARKLADLKGDPHSLFGANLLEFVRAVDSGKEPSEPTFGEQELGSDAANIAQSAPNQRG